MTAHIKCPCGWSQDVELVPTARITINRILADHAGEHLRKGEAIPAPKVAVAP